MAGADIDQFVDQVLERRRSSGQAAVLADESIYRILDGLLAAKREEANLDAA